MPNPRARARSGDKQPPQEDGGSRGEKLPASGPSPGTEKAGRGGVGAEKR